MRKHNYSWKGTQLLSWENSVLVRGEHNYCHEETQWWGGMSHILFTNTHTHTCTQKIGDDAQHSLHDETGRADARGHTRRCISAICAGVFWEMVSRWWLAAVVFWCACSRLCVRVCQCVGVHVFWYICSQSCMCESVCTCAYLHVCICVVFLRNVGFISMSA